MEPPITLESYAMVMAGLSAGVGLDAALANADVDRSKWDEASEHWQTAIDESADDDLAVLVAFDAALVAAKRKYEPVFEPIESDVEAWTRFRRHFVTAVDPVAFVGEQGISLSSYARLEAAWVERLAADAALSERATALMNGPLGDCPKLESRPSELMRGRSVASSAPPPVVREAPLPQSKPSAPPARVPASSPPPVPASSPPPPARAMPSFLAAAPPPPVGQLGRLAEQLVHEDTADTADVPTPSIAQPMPFQGASADAPSVPLERYAVMFADASLFRMNTAQLTAKHQISAADLSAAFSYWQKRAAADVGVRARVDDAVERYRLALVKTGRLGTPAPQAAVHPNAGGSNAGGDTLPDPESVPDRAGTTAPVGIDAHAVRAALPFVKAGLPLPPHLAAMRVAPPTPAVRTGTVSIDADVISAARAGSMTMVAGAAPDGPALPFAAAREIEGFTLEGYARIVAELSIRGADRKLVFARNRVSGDDHYKRIADAWNKAVQDQGLTGQYMRFFTRIHDELHGRR